MGRWYLYSAGIVYREQVSMTCFWMKNLFDSLFSPIIVNIQCVCVFVCSKIIRIQVTCIEYVKFSSVWIQFVCLLIKIVEPNKMLVQASSTQSKWIQMLSLLVSEMTFQRRFFSVIKLLIFLTAMVTMIVLLLSIDVVVGEECKCFMIDWFMIDWLILLFNVCISSAQHWVWS